MQEPGTDLASLPTASYALCSLLAEFQECPGSGWSSKPWEHGEFFPAYFFPGATPYYLDWDNLTRVPSWLHLTSYLLSQVVSALPGWCFTELLGSASPLPPAGSTAREELPF